MSHTLHTAFDFCMLYHFNPILRERSTGAVD